MPTQLKPANQLKKMNLQRFFSNPKRWVKGEDMTDCGTACCLRGAVSHVLPYEKRGEATAKILKAIRRFQSSVLKKPAKLAPNNLVAFNDASERKIEHIQWVVRHAGV